MKSIIEEASSISKAIDQAWQRAGKPQEFTIKVFEEPQRSIFGLTIRSAKIALFFNERAVAGQHNTAEPKKHRPEQIVRPLANEATRETHREIPVSKPAAQHHVPKEHSAQKKAHIDNREPKEVAPSEKQQPRKRRSTWSDELIDSTKIWINSCFNIMKLPAVSYETSVIGNNLNIQFTSKLLANEQSERLLFSSFAHLIMLGLGQSYKKRFPNLKIILKSSK
jgi:hypothetical protein